MDDLRNPLARVRGLGSAKEGVAHWWAQRVTAVALVPLVLWFVASLAAMSGAGFETASEWLASPVASILTILLIVASFHHAQLGLQVVIEDYVHCEAGKVALILLVKGAAIVLALAGVFAVLLNALGG